MIMASVCRLLLLLALAELAQAAPAQAADVVFPAGSRIGLAPPPGVTASRSFLGFEDPERNVAIIILTLPAEAFAQIEKSTAADALKRQGVTIEKREPLALPIGKAFLVIGRQEVERMKLRKWIAVAAAPDLTALVTVQVPDDARRAYPDAAIASLAVRATVPVEEQLGLLPFRVGEFANFRVGGVLAGRAVILTDAASDASGPRVDPHIVVAVAPGGPTQAADRDTFARELFLTIPNLREVRIDTSESLRIGGQQGHQILATGKDPAGTTDITIVQWLRFGGGAYLHLIGVAPSAAWTPAYARFRAVRDSIEAR